MKKKSILFAALFCAAITAQAGSYSDEYARRQACDTIAKMGKFAFISNDPDYKQLRMNPDGTWELAIEQWAVEYGSKYALNEEDAYNASYAKCMDNLWIAYKRRKEHYMKIEELR